HTGTGNFNSSLVHDTKVTGLTKGINEFIWTVTHEGCIKRDTVRITNNLPSQAYAGGNQNLCADSTFLNATMPLIGTGNWLTPQSPVVISNILSANSKVNGLQLGLNKLVWQTNHEGCILTDTAYIYNNQPSKANAGADQIVCQDQATLSGTAPIQGTGEWNIVAGGTGAINNRFQHNSLVTNLSLGNNYFIWTVQYPSGGCPASVDTVLINNNRPTTANANIDQNICRNFTNLAGNTPIQGIGAWTKHNTPALIQTPSISSSEVTDLREGANTFIWTISTANCPPSRDTVIINNRLPSRANAGSDKEVCDTKATITAIVPTQGTGVWLSYIPTSVTINPVSGQSHIAEVQNLREGYNFMIWRVSHGGCPDSYDTVRVNNKLPTAANAGNDQIICSNSSSLSANTPTQGVGVWSVLGGGPAVVTNINSPGSSVNNLRLGDNFMIWTVSHGGCLPSRDTVRVVNNLPSTANANSDQILCRDSTFMDAIVPTQGNGSWSLVNSQSPVFITGINDPKTKVSNLPLGNNLFIWTVSQSGCPASRDTVNIINNLPSKANAGNTQSLCRNYVSMSATTPVQGTGAWSAINNSFAEIDVSQGSPNAVISNLQLGQNIFEWRVTNGGCPASRDTVIITNNLPSNANAGSDQELCDNTTFLQGNTPLQGTGLWIPVNTTAGITNSGNPASQVNQLKVGFNTFVWQISNLSCPSSRDTVIIYNKLPSPALAGTDQVICRDSTVLTSVVPEQGNGFWTRVSTSAVMESPELNTTKVRSLQKDVNKFVWTVTHGGCSPSRDTIRVINNLPDVPLAGTDQHLCSPSAFMNGNIPVHGSGSWHLKNGNAVIEESSNASTAVSQLQPGPNTFIWRINKEGCILEDEVIIYNEQLTQVEISGASYRHTCFNSNPLLANDPALEIETASGKWSIISQPEFNNSYYENEDQNSTFIHSMYMPGEYLLKWEVFNHTCDTLSATVSLILDEDIEALGGNDTLICSDTVRLNAEPVI
ncbi:MAG: hypothetical protein ACK4ND_15885, partial [Cytophagaceae bacterium]